MTEGQENWLAGHPDFEVTKFLGIVSCFSYANLRYIDDKGDELPEKPKPAPFMDGAFSCGGTLYSRLTFIEVGRKVSIA